MTEAPFLRATRESYDALAAAGAQLIVGGDLGELPLDRALLTAFAEWVAAAGGGTVADVGCGRGLVTRFLADLGVDVFGVDLSPEIVALARRTYPDLRFEVGSMLALDLPDGCLGGLLACYSIIHVPWEYRPRVFAEFHRVLAPGGQLMLAFQIGDEHRHFEELDGLPIALDYYRQQPDQVVELLERGGFAVRVRVVREPDGMRKPPHGCVMAHKPV